MGLGLMFYIVGIVTHIHYMTLELNYKNYKIQINMLLIKYELNV